MTWDPKTSCGNEQDKIAAFAIPYCRGKGLDLGCGGRKVWPHAIGIDNGKTFGKGDTDIIGEIDDLSLFADESMDFVFSSHALEDFPEEKVPTVLKEWTRVLKVGGNLILYVPSANFYPKVGDPGANPAHKWNIYPGDIGKHLQGSTTSGWTLLENEERSKTNEYSLFEVYQKRSDGKWVENVWQRNPHGKKRCLVIRYGAIGDQIVASSILPELRKQGWYVTYNTTPDGRNIIEHDPHVDEWLIQDKDQVPNVQLGPYWQCLAERYDRIINLCESVEGLLLALPGRVNHSYPIEGRRKIANRNYLELTHDIAAVPHEFHSKFYATEHEQTWAKFTRKQMNGPAVVWCINGSSPHKVYPFTQVVTGWLLEKTPCHVVYLSDLGIGKELKDGILTCLKEDGFDLSRVHDIVGKWTLRQALAFSQIADVVVGPETGPMNAVSLERVPKVIYLSHSSHENLTKHWKNTRVLLPENTPCYPCHMLHYTWEHCHQDEKTAAALCASSITPERVFVAIMGALGAERVKVA